MSEFFDTQFEFYYRNHYIKYVWLYCQMTIVLRRVIYRVVGNWWYKQEGGDSKQKRSRKYRIKIFRLRLCFRENRLWIFARYGCTLSRLVITDLTVDRCLDWRYVDRHFQCDPSVFLPINLLSDFYRYPLSVPISLPSCLHTAIGNIRTWYFR